MNVEMVTDAIGRIWGTSAQRWALGVLAVGAAVAASVFASLAAGNLAWVPLVAVVFLAVLSAVVPDSYVPLVVVGVVVSQWFIEVDDVGSAWSLVAAFGLIVFHLIVALMAVTPSNAIVVASVLAGWLRRGGVVMVATAAVWGGVAVLDGRSVPGSAVLVLAALVTSTALIVAAGARSGSSTRPS